MKVLFVGATKGMGRAVSRLMAARGDRLYLLGRSDEDLARSASDLQARSSSQSEVRWSLCDLDRPDTFRDAIARADDALQGFDTLVLSAGAFGTQDALEADLDRTARVLTVDFVNTVLFCELVRARLLSRGGGTLCVFSSVAGERGRKPVVLYGAAKAGLTHYLEGLDHRYRDQGLKTVCIKPGFVTTSMTEGLRPPPFAADAETIAPLVLSAIDRGRPVTYVPRIWGLIMFVIRLLPRQVMRRVGF